MNNTLAIIINPKSGKKHYLRQRYYLFALLEKRGEPYTYRVTRYAGHATEIARAMAEQGYRRFLILGGDGTISETINGLMSAKIVDKESIRFGIMPRGTGNDYGRYWGITRHYKQALERFFNGTPKPIDVGCLTYYRNDDVHKRYFVNSVGFGIDARTCAVAQTLKYYLGSHSLLYALSLVCAVWSHKSQPIALTADGDKLFEEPLFTMNIGVGPYSGGGIRQNPQADPTDGIFHAMFLRPPTFKQIMHAIPHLFNGRLTDLPFVHTYTSHSVDIASQDYLLFEADGILIDACGPYRVECMHHALQIVC